VQKNLKTRASELERRIRERAEVVKQVLREYRESQQAAGTRTVQRERAKLLKKKRDIERANAEYIQLQKELDQLRVRMQASSK
jgi:hypothetical protein